MAFNPIWKTDEYYGALLLLCESGYSDEKAQKSTNARDFCLTVAMGDPEVKLYVNNLFNSEGVMSWASGGGLTSSLDRQGFTPARLAADPNQFLNVITVQPRSFYLTLDVKF